MLEMQQNRLKIKHPGAFQILQGRKDPSKKFSRI